MKDRALVFINHPLVKGSSIIFIGSLLGNILNFLFNLFMSRNLSIADYGILTSLISLVSIFGFRAGSVVPTVVNFAAIYFAKEKLDNVRSLYFKVSKFFSGVGIIILVAFFVFAGQIGDFFNIHNNSLIFLAGINIFIGFISVANMPLLQARLSFKFITAAGIIGSSFKLIFGVVLVLLGFAVGGAMWAYFISSLFPYILSFIPLRFLFFGNKNDSEIKLKKLFSYGVPASLTLFGLSSL
jgi:O-antigen/teichoic acid export membrane protein